MADPTREQLEDKLPPATSFLGEKLQLLSLLFRSRLARRRAAKATATATQGPGEGEGEGEGEREGDGGPAAAAAPALGPAECASGAAIACAREEIEAARPRAVPAATAAPTTPTTTTATKPTPKRRWALQRVRGGPAAAPAASLVPVPPPPSSPPPPLGALGASVERALHEAADAPAPMAREAMHPAPHRTLAEQAAAGAARVGAGETRGVGGGGGGMP